MFYVVYVYLAIPKDLKMMIEGWAQKDLGTTSLEYVDCGIKTSIFGQYTGYVTVRTPEGKIIVLRVEIERIHDRQARYGWDERSFNLIEYCYY